MKPKCEQVYRFKILFSILEFHRNVILVTMFAWAVLVLTIFDSPTAVSEERPHNAWLLWVMWHLLAPPAIWTGQLITNERKKWLLLWAGDSALCVMIFQHVEALIPQARVGVVSAGYLMTIMAGMGVSVFASSTRDVIEVARVYHWCDRIRPWCKRFSWCRR